MSDPEARSTKQDGSAGGGFASLVGAAEVISLGQILATGTRLGFLIFGACNVGIGALVLTRAWRVQAQKIAIIAFVLVVGGALVTGVSLDRFTAAWSIAGSAEPTTKAPSSSPPSSGPSPASQVVYVDSLTPTEPTEWGRGSFALNGQVYRHSLSAHICPSKNYLFTSQTFALGGLYNRFSATVALAADSKNSTPMLFEVIADGKIRLFSKSVAIGPPAIIQVTVKSVQQLQLVVKPDSNFQANQYGCSEDDARAIWGDPRLEP
jgi:hypothetical protein